MIDIAPGTVVLFSDITCPWARLAVHRLHEARARLGLDDDVRIDHRAFALELVNGKPTPKAVLDAEIPVIGALAPDAGWQVWQAPVDQYPSTSLVALEAVQAAKETEGLAASERLDRALRTAMFGQSRCISILPVVLEVAEESGLDVDALRAALAEGRGRTAVAEQVELASGDEVDGSPHLFLPDGTDVHNPGVTMHWEGEHGKGFPVVDDDDPSVYDDLLKRAAGS